MIYRVGDKIRFKTKEQVIEEGLEYLISDKRMFNYLGTTGTIYWLDSRTYQMMVKENPYFWSQRLIDGYEDGYKMVKDLLMEINMKIDYLMKTETDTKKLTEVFKRIKDVLDDVDVEIC